MRIVIILALFGIGVISATANIHALEPSQSLFQVLETIKGKIHAGCQPTAIPNDFIPGKKLNNPGIVTDQEIIRKINQEKLINPSMVKSMYFSVYKYKDEKHEVGVFGWELTSPSVAKKIYDQLSIEYEKNSDNIKAWLKNHFLIMLWRDPGGSLDCFDAFKMQIPKAIGQTEDGK